MVIFAINSILLLSGSDNSNTNEFTGYYISKKYNSPRNLH